jgi:hypothetical protein
MNTSSAHLDWKMMLRLSGLCFLIAVLTFTQILQSKQLVRMYPSACTLALLPQSNELARGPPELVQNFRLWGRVHNGARAHVLNLIWFGYIPRLSQWGGGG